MIEFPKQIQADLDMINEVAVDLQMKLYVVGGFPRDLVSGKGVTDKTDIDVTEANGNAFDLAFFVAAKYDFPDPVVYDSSGTALVTMPSGRAIEFHNAYYNIPHIIDELFIQGVEPTPLNKDVYARDFTINTLLFDPDTGKILDITGKGISDIKEKVLRTPISPGKILKHSPKNILRGIRFKLQMGLIEDKEYSIEVHNFVPNLIKFLEQHPDSKMVKETVKKCLQSDPHKAVHEFRKLGILQYLPSEIEMDNVIKEEMFGTNIHHVSLEKEAQSKMMQRIINEREKHKAYMRRKRKEDTDSKKEKMQILERANSGYYLHNDEPDFVKDRKIDKRRKLFDFITKRDYSGGVK